jgi:hypothetical protein
VHARNQLIRGDLGVIVGLDHDCRHIVAGRHTFEFDNNEIVGVLCGELAHCRKKCRPAAAAQAAKCDLNRHSADLSGRRAAPITGLHSNPVRV